MLFLKSCKKDTDEQIDNENINETNDEKLEKIKDQISEDNTYQKIFFEKRIKIFKEFIKDIKPNDKIDYCRICWTLNKSNKLKKDKELTVCSFCKNAAWECGGCHKHKMPYKYYTYNGKYNSDRKYLENNTPYCRNCMDSKKNCDECHKAFIKEKKYEEEKYEDEDDNAPSLCPKCVSSLKCHHCKNHNLTIGSKKKTIDDESVYLCSDCNSKCWECNSNSNVDELVKKSILYKDIFLCNKCNNNCWKCVKCTKDYLYGQEKLFYDNNLDHDLYCKKCFDRTWRCLSCSIINDDNGQDNQYCTMCKKPKKDNIQWACSHCTVLNFIDVGNCKMCHAERNQQQ